MKSYILGIIIIVCGCHSETPAESLPSCDFTLALSPDSSFVSLGTVIDFTVKLTGNPSETERRLTWMTSDTARIRILSSTDSSAKVQAGYSGSIQARSTACPNIADVSKLTAWVASSARK